jgi:O-antigen ligase
MDPSVIFAWIIAVLAGAACIGALVFAIVWEICAIRRTLAAHRHVGPPATYWSDRAAVTAPERRP